MSVKELKKGDEFMMLKDYNVALQLYLTAWQLDSNNLDVNIAISEVLIALNDPEEAERWAIKSLAKLGPSLQLQLIISISLQEKGKVLESLNQLSTLALEKGFKTNYKLWFYIGLGNFKLKRFKEAKLAFEKSIKYYSNFPMAHYLLGKVMLELDYSPLSLLCFYYFLLLDPTSQFANEALILINQNLKTDWLNRNIAKMNQNSPNLTREFSQTLRKKFIELEKTVSDSIKQNYIVNFELHTAKYFSLLFTELEPYPELKGSIWSEYYMPFFYNMYITNNTQTFCYIISQNIDSKYTNWLILNPTDYTKFEKWLKRRR